jgi:predicted transcriptional regulator
MEKSVETVGLLSGDQPLIAGVLGVSLATVSDTLKKRRGKRTTLVQLKIKKAAEFCIQKNKEKIAYYKELSDND